RGVAARALPAQLHRAERGAGLAHASVASRRIEAACLRVIAQDVIAPAEPIAETEAGGDIAVAAGLAQLHDLGVVLAAGAERQYREDEKGAETHREPGGGRHADDSWV